MISTVWEGDDDSFGSQVGYQSIWHTCEGARELTCKYLTSGLGVTWPHQINIVEYGIGVYFIGGQNHLEWIRLQ